MLVIHRNSAAAQCAVKRLGALPCLQPLHQRRALADGHIDRARIFVDEVKPLCHGAKRQAAAADARFKGFDNAILVKRFPTQCAQFAEIALHGFLCGGISPVFQRMACCPHRRAEQKRRQLRPLKNRYDALLCWPLSLAVAAPRRLQNGIQSRQLTVDRGKVHIHTRLDEGCRHHTARLALL